MNTWQVLYKGGSVTQKAIGIISGFLKRLKLVLWDIRKADVIFIHREAAPIGPPVFEWILTRVRRKKVIFDFDDAIWIPNTSAENKLAASVKAFWKIPKILSWVDTVAGGNDYLCKYATSQNATNVVRIPTVVDTNNRYNRLKVHSPGHKTVVGWTGSHSTLKYLDELMPVLQALQERLDFTFLVIADKQPELPLKDWEFVPWNAATEIEDLLKIDIGVMPLTADAWSEGKCGFKLIQYLALAIPAIASPVGVNSVIVQEHENGYLCSSPEEWTAALETLINDVPLRNTMGHNGRVKMVNEYSIDAIAPSFTGLFIKA
ncbi:glycosyltransferase, group 1 family protein [Ostertagia ostertagi]